MSGIMAEVYAVIKPLSQGLTYRLSEFHVAVNLPQMEKTFIDRIEERLVALGISAQAACVAAGLSKDAIRNWQRKPDIQPNVRSLTALAGVLGVTVQWILTGDESISSEDIAATLDGTAAEGMQYGGKLEASTFRPIDLYDQTGEEKRVPLPFHPDYPREDQIAYEVVGDSMNEARMEEGMWVAAIRLPAWERKNKELRGGTSVVVRRTRANFSEREVTVKEVRFFPDRTEFWPRSKNPKHKPLIVPKDHSNEDEKVEIFAVVYWSGWDHEGNWK